MSDVFDLPQHMLRIVGQPHSGWRLAQDGEDDVKVLAFHFRIIANGAGSAVLAFASLDGHYEADRTYENVPSALAAAEDLFDIDPKAWFAVADERR